MLKIKFLILLSELLEVFLIKKKNEVKNEIPSISALATTSALTAVENKILSVCNLVEKTDYNTKVTEIEKKLTDHKHDGYITTPEFNKLTTENCAARLKQSNLVTKTDFDAKLLSLNRKITLNKTNQLVTENELKKLKTFDSIYFCGKSHFEDDGIQNWLVFKSIQKYFKTVSTTDSNTLSWQSKGLSDGSIKPPNTSNKLFNPSLYFVGSEARVKFNRDCLNQEKITVIMEK